MRKAKPKKRVILPDPVYGDQKVSKFVNHLMFDGKKNVSYEIFYKSLEIVGEKMKRHIGVTATATRALSENNINIQMMSHLEGSFGQDNAPSRS